jgi:hypothetical protein
MINWWKKGYFDDLRPFDVLPLEDILHRYQGALSTFPGYDSQFDAGFFFLGISSDNLNDPDVKYFHEKFNSPACNLLEYPRKKIALTYKPGRNFNRPEYHGPENIKFKGNTSNYNGRDGQIRGGWATPYLEEFHLEPLRKGRVTGEWIYLHIPHKLLYNFLNTTNNGVPIQIAKKFVNEIESTIGWEDIEEVKKIVEIYDEKYPDWNHDFPINGYIQMKKDGLLFPSVWWLPHMLCGHSFHRMIMTSFNKLDFPYILPVPASNPDHWFAISKDKNFLFNAEEQYLTVEINRKEKMATYSFSTDPEWANKRNTNLTRIL